MMNSRWLPLAACFFLVACSPDTETPVATEAETNFEIEFEKYTLDNGLDVILHVDNSDPVVAVASLFHVGSNREVVGRTGFAHFFEHMSFNDSENVPRGANRKYIAELGGSRNGGTNFDYTQYYEVVPSDAMEKIFWIDSDRMGYMINTVTEEALEREKQVVKNEKRQRNDNAPYGHTWSVILVAMFPEGHPYSWPVIGSLEDLQNATLDDVKEFYARWYGANNATLAIAGDFDPEKIKPQIEQWFGEMRRGPEVQDAKPIPVSLEASRNLWYPDNFAKLPALTRVYPSVERYHPDSYALDVLAQVLAGSKKAPLYKVIVEETKLAPAASADNAAFELAGMFMVSVRAMEGTKLDDVEAALEEGLARFAKDGFSDTELTRIKAELETAFYSGLSSVLNKARGLANYSEFAGDPGFATEEIRRIQAVSREDITRVFEQYIQGKHFVQTSFVPKEAPELAVANAELANVTEEKIVQGAEAEVSQGAVAEYEKTASKYDRSEPPLGPPPLVRSPDIWTRSLANGIEVSGIEDREVPLVAFHLMLPGGQWLDSNERVGAASLLAALSMQGTVSRTPAELEEAIGLLGAQISFSASSESFGISAITLERNLGETVALVEEMLLEPRWDTAEFERLRSATEASIAAAEGSAGAIAYRVFRASLYGESHPFGRLAGGTRETIAAMTIDDLKEWHAAHVTPAGARLQVVGAVSGDRVEQAFGSLADRWTGEAIAMPEYELQPAGKAGSVYFVDVPDAKQSVIMVGKRAVPVTDPEWLKIDLANMRLGGDMSARLMQLLRIEKGYTYGAGSGIGSYVADASPWRAYTNVRANVTLESMQLIREQIANYPGTFTDTDASVTKNQVIKSNARAFETLGAKLSLLDRIAEQDLPHDTVEQETAVLEGMSTADFQQVIEDHMDESEMVWVIVGDAETQLQRIKESGFGEVIELDRLGRPLSGDAQEDSTSDTVRIAVASFAMETCTFCPRPTDIEHFEFYGEPFTGDAVLESGGASQAFARAASEYQDVEVIGVYAVRDPVGGSMGSWVTERAFDKFAGEIVERLAAIEDLDAVYLPLHGAMAVTGIPRPEAELARRIKAELGDIPIAVTYDLHANEDAEIANHADIVLIVKRFPHYDFGLMGERAARLLIRTVRGGYEPVLEVRRPNIAFATVYGGTHQGVPRDMMERARRWENRRPDVYVSVAMGFPFADVPDVGMSVFVQTNGDRALASEIADDMTQYIWSRRDEFEYDIPKLSEGVEQGLAALDAGNGRLVLANLSDRLGDATHILGQLLERGRSNFVVASIEDASAIETIKKDYAVGDAIEIVIGGHTSELAGEPVAIDGIVSFIGAYDIGGSVESDLVALNFGDNNWVLLTPDRYQVTTRSILDHAGVPVEEMDIFVVKSRNHFRRGFMETGLAKTAVVIDAPGHGPADIGQLPFQNLPEETYSRFLSE